MTRRVALCFLALAPPLVLLSFVVPGRLPEVLFATVAMAFPVALIGLVTGRSGDRGSLAPWLIALLLILEASTVGMLLLRGKVADGPWIGGLPAAAAIQLFGLWLVPLGLVALVYALTFDRHELREEDLARLRQARRERGGVD